MGRRVGGGRGNGGDLTNGYWPSGCTGAGREAAVGLSNVEFEVMEREAAHGGQRLENRRREGTVRVTYEGMLQMEKVQNGAEGSEKRVRQCAYHSM